MNRYRSDLAPGQVLSFLVSAANYKSLKVPAVSGYYAASFQSDAMRQAVVDVFANLDPGVQPAVLSVMKLGGCDLKQLFPGLPPEKLEQLNAIKTLNDPREHLRFTDPVDVTLVSELGETMDRCWAGWMATGDPSFLRALVELLGGAADYPEFKKWQNARGGAKGLNAKVMRGLAYQIAGWSIHSFQRTDPQVSDWLLYWQQDPEVSDTIKQEIATLPTNPAFKRN